MKTLYCTSALVLLAGCGSQPTAPVVVDPALAPYLASFTANTGVSSDGISAQFADTTTSSTPLGEVVGECVLYSNGSRLIQVDPTYWASMGDDQRAQLMYHELGHCAMYLGHTPGNIDSGAMNGCPISIMNPYTFGSTWIWCYDDDAQYYYNELKSHG